MRVSGRRRIASRKRPWSMWRMKKPNGFCRPGSDRKHALPADKADSVENFAEEQAAWSEGKSESHEQDFLDKIRML